MKTSTILICPMVRLRELPEEDLEVLRRVLLDGIQGVNAQHQRRWLRLWGWIFNAEPGDMLAIFSGQERNLRFHNRWMAIEQRLFDNQEGYAHLERFRDWLKTGAGFGHYKHTRRGMEFCPSSVSYEQCSEDEMREFVAAAIEFLNTPQALATLFPAVPERQRHRVLEAVMRDPKQPQESESHG